MQDFTDEYEEYYGDEPEGIWAKCDECDTLMEYSARLEKFRCPCCGKEVGEDEYEEYYDNDDLPPWLLSVWWTVSLMQRGMRYV